MSLLKVTVYPSSKKNQITKIDDGVYEVKLKAKPIKNQANILLIHLLADYFNCDKQKIRIISGHHSPKKHLEINGI